ncbi:MAG: hypothetical protein ACUVXJ_13145 [Phycisphaerae bacterium]
MADALSSDELADLRMVSISSDPLEKHHVDLCPHYERHWRNLAPTVISAIQGNSKAMVMWARGPMYVTGLPAIVRYVVHARYFIERVANISDPDGGEYVTSWLAFEFNPYAFELMMKDSSVDLEDTRLFGLAVEKPQVESVVSQPFENFGLSWVIEQGAIAMTFFSHFEGCNIVGPYDLLEAAEQRVRALAG